MLKEAAETLLNVCDGARTQDGAGFNRFDGGFVRSLPLERLTPKQALALYNLLGKYRGQLARYGIDYTKIEKPEIPSAGAPIDMVAIRAKLAAQPLPPKPAQPEPVRKISIDGDLFIIEFPYNQTDVDRVKKTIPTARFKDDNGRKYWWVAVGVGTAEGIQELSKTIPCDSGVADRCAVIIEKAVLNTELSRIEAHSLDMGDFLKPPRPFQNGGIQYWVNNERVFIADAMGLGKQAPTWEPVLTPSGWRTLGELRPGDFVIGQNGKPTKVLKIFPQTDRSCFRVTMNDGSHTYCGADHLWQVQTNADHRAKKWRVMTTREIIDSGLRDGAGNLKFRIPMVAPVEFETKELPMDPYLLGVILSDGHITKDGQVSITSDSELCVAVTGRATVRKNSFTSSTRAYKSALAAMGLTHKLSYEKFVPRAYLIGDIEQRKALLAGLMDGDGCPHVGGGTEYSTTSPFLRDAVIELVQSLGGTARWSTKRAPRYTHRGEKHTGRDCYRINVKLNFNPFRLERKAGKWKAPTKYKANRLIKQIEQAEDAKSVCILVDAADHLYVTRNYIVTHNTIQALGGLFYLGIDRALVNCPATLKPNWGKEAASCIPAAGRMFFSGRRKSLEHYDPQGNYLCTEYPYAHARVMRPDYMVIVCDSKAPDDLVDQANLVIVNYDLLSAGWLDQKKKQVTLTPLAVRACAEIKAYICDESHYLKNEKAQRTCAAKKISRDIKYRALLTGTPIDNRPMEIISQLDILDRLDEFGGSWKFKQRYCGAYQMRIPGRGMVWDFKGSSNLAELNAKLRATCFIRRKKEDVLTELPPKTWVTLPFELSNRKDYTKAEKDILKYVKEIAYLAEKTKHVDSDTVRDEDALSPAEIEERARIAADLAAAKAARAQVLVGIGILRRLCAEGKIAQIKEWVADFMESDEKLVVFAHHVEIQKQLLEEFKQWGAVSVMGSDAPSVRAQNVTTFQNDPGCRVIVVSLSAGAEGITLTASSTVLFVEHPWTPGKKAQAEDRCHRMGQVDNVTIYDTIATMSFDEDLAALLRDKSEIVAALADGDQTTSASQLQEILTRIAARH